MRRLTGRPSPTPAWGWVLAAMGAHTGWGAYPVLARYLQTVSHLPGMALLAAGNLLALAGLALLFRRRLDFSFVRLPVLWLFGLSIAVLGTTSVLAARYTLAIYVQLLSLLTPFFVALLGTALLRERLPAYTGRALLLTTVGGLLVLSGGFGAAAGGGLALAGDDGWGLFLALVSALALAFYLILARQASAQGVPAEMTQIVHLVTLTGVSLLLSGLMGESWRGWAGLGLADWLVFAAFSLGVLLAATLAQISALHHLSAALVGSMLPWRLVAALAFSALLLGERLTSAWQVGGALLVLGTLTWYLWQQR